jgi:hypothetical protein
MMARRGREKKKSIQDFLLDVYTEEKESALARIRGTEKGLDVIREISQLWTKEDMAHAEDLITRMRRFVLHLNSLKIIVRQHSAGTGKQAIQCRYCGESGQSIGPKYPCDTLRWLAMPYLGYPDFDQSWYVGPEQFENLSPLHREELHENVELLRQRKEST